MLREVQRKGWAGPQPPSSARSQPRAKLAGRGGGGATREPRKNNKPQVQTYLLLSLNCETNFLTSLQPGCSLLRGGKARRKLNKISPDKVAEDEITRERERWRVHPSFSFCSSCRADKEPAAAAGPPLPPPPGRSRGPALPSPSASSHRRNFPSSPSLLSPEPVSGAKLPSN